jgi:nucleotide-binding universal stress UspA family protein
MAPCPGAVGGKKFRWVFMKILLPVDGSEYSTKAVNYISTHLDLFQGERELHLLHVKAPIPLGHARAAVGSEAVESYYKEEAAKALAPSEELLSKSGIPYKSGYKIGDVASQIQTYAKQHGIDMIVMGSHGHGAFTKLVMGSVATKVMSSTTVPVLIIR